MAMAAPPALWLGAFYLLALLFLLIAAFWQVDAMSGAIVHDWTLSNFALLLHDPTYRIVAQRTIAMAIGVTVTDCLLALPLAYFMTFIVRPRWRGTVLMLVLIPLWSSLLARIYAWRLILAHDGIANWLLQSLGFGTSEIGYSLVAVWLVSSYLWLPFVVLPLASALERVPSSLLDASADLGAHGGRGFRKVILPLALPGLAAGSISAFSLTLGDFVTPMLVGGAGSDFIGNTIYTSVGVANNLPLAAAFALVPLAVAGGYLLLMHRLGAFKAL
jgi:putative spermidine/putrescine transport system permease protein